MGRRIIFLSLLALALPVPTAGAVAGTQRLHFAAGPYKVTPGANLILLQYRQVPKPTRDGFIVRMAPNLHYARPDGRCCAGIPRVDVIHLHHGVWLSNGTAGEGEGSNFGGFYPFLATGEEKTVTALPPGYGYPVGAHDYWVINYMIHNLTSRATKVYITYDLDFVPATAPAAAHIIPAHPIWMDVEAHSIYPVFDVLRGSGRGGRYTFPDMARSPYGAGPPRNELTLDHSGTLLGTAGHLHPGGLYTDLDLIRAGASPRPRDGGSPPSRSSNDQPTCDLSNSPNSVQLMLRPSTITRGPSPGRPNSSSSSPSSRRPATTSPAIVTPCLASSLRYGWAIAARASIGRRSARGAGSAT